MKPKIFISYITENFNIVELIKKELQYAGAQVWLDKDVLTPGVRWKKEIRTNIEESDFFLAFFSKEYHTKQRSYMNEELTIAIENMRLLHSEKVWFIPIRIDDCKIPDIEVGKGESLGALQWIDLDSRNIEQGLEKLVRLLNPPRELVTINLNNLGYLGAIFSNGLFNAIGHLSVVLLKTDDLFYEKKEIDVSATSKQLRVAIAHNELLLQLSKLLRDILLINDDRFYFLRKTVNIRGIVWRLSGRISSITEWYQNPVAITFDHSMNHSWVRISIELFECLLITLSDFLFRYMQAQEVLEKGNMSVIYINLSEDRELSLRAEIKVSNAHLKLSEVQGITVMKEFLEQLIARLDGEMQFITNQSEKLKKVLIKISNVDPRSTHLEGE